MTETTAARYPAPPVVRAANVAAKAILLAMLVSAMLDPDASNLRGKAAELRAVAYPMLAFTVPAIWLAFWKDRASFPWLADLFVTVTCFSDILGNRLDLYDSVVWFDDLMHVAAVTCLSAALVLLTMQRTTSAVAVLERSVALGMTAALLWELFELVAFVTRSAELPTAYADTLGDLLAGWCGTVLAALLVHHAWRHHLPDPDEVSAEAQARLAG